MAKEGLPFILLFSVPALLAAGAAGLLGVLWLWPVVAMLGVLAAFMAYFFRDPERESPTDANVVVSPADGTVMVVERVAPDAAVSPTQVSIFLSPLDVHIN